MSDGPSLRQRLLVPSVVGLIALAAFLDTTVSGRAPVMLSSDLPSHMDFGEWMLAHGRLIPVDPTNYAFPDTPYIDHEWLVQLVLAAAFRLAGMPGVVVLAALLLAAVFGTLARCCRRRGVGPALTIGLALAAFQFAKVHLLIRPHLLSWWFGLLWLDWIDRHRTGDLTTAGLLARGGPLMLVWANAHAGFLLAFYLLGLVGLGAIAERAWDRLRQLVLVGLALLLVSCINPYGPVLHTHFLGLLTDAELQGPIDEWRSPNFSASTYKLPLVLWLASLLLLLRGERPSWTDAILFLGLSYSALKMQRNVAVLGLLTAPVVGVALQRRLGGLVDDRDPRVGGWLVLLLVAALAATRADAPYPPQHFPVEAVDYILAHPEQCAGRMYNVYGWGGYLAHRLGRPVLINGLNDHYGAAHYWQYRRVYTLQPGWEQTLDDWGVRWVVYNTDTPLTAMLDRHPAWRRVHRDPLATIHVRR